MTKTANEVSKLAIIIGIDSYRSEGLEDLPSCKKDAEDLYKLLCDLGYTIFRNEPIIGSKLEGPNAYTKVHRAIRDFFINAEPGQTLLFYFSGHGIPREHELYLAMPEVNSIDPMIEGFSLSNLTTLMNSSKSMKIVSIIDACYSGAANLPDARMKAKAAKETAGRALATYDRVLDNISKAKGRCFLLSSQEYERSLAVPNSNSLYTKYLVEGLTGAEPTIDEKGRKFPASVDDYGNVTPETLHNYVYYKVASEARQVPKIKFEKASDIILAEHPKLVKRPPSGPSIDVSWLIEEGKQFLEYGDFDSAIKSFDHAISADPKNAAAYNYKGDVLFKLKRYEEAIKSYDEALKIQPKYQDVLKDKGLSLDNLGKYQEAIDCFSAALEINPKIARNWYYKGLALSKLPNNEEAIRCYDEALRLEPNNVDVWIGKGVCFGILKKYKEAIECYDKVIGIDPNNAVAHEKKKTILQIISEETKSAQEQEQQQRSPNNASLSSRSPIQPIPLPSQQEQSPIHSHQPAATNYTPLSFSSAIKERKDDKREEYYNERSPSGGVKLQPSWINPKILIPIIALAIIGSVIAFAVFSTTTTPPPETTTTTTPPPPPTSETQPQQISLVLNSADYITYPTDSSLHQVRVFVDYTVNDPSIVNQTINAVMNVYTLNGTLIKTSSFPAGFTANNFGTQLLATTIKENPIQNITAVITITNAAKLIPLSNTVYARL